MSGYHEGIDFVAFFAVHKVFDSGGGGSCRVCLGIEVVNVPTGLFARDSIVQGLTSGTPDKRRHDLNLYIHTFKYTYKEKRGHITSGIMVTYTILESLSELKLIKERINKRVSSTTFVSVWKSDENKNKDTICADAKSQFQSVQALLKRRSQIKAKIMQSNATTKVQIGGIEYTVAEAIAVKEMIAEHRMFLDTLKMQHARALRSVDDYNSDRQRRIDSLLDRNFSKDSGKANADDIRTITEMYQKKYYIEMVDPLEIAKEIERLEEYIQTFESNVNTKLAHSNAVTTIEVDDN